jgi:hypothetical protein
LWQQYSCLILYYLWQQYSFPRTTVGIIIQNKITRKENKYLSRLLPIIFFISPRFRVRPCPLIRGNFKCK